MEELKQTVAEVKETIYLTHCNNGNAFCMPGKFLLASQELRWISQDDSQIIPFIVMGSKRQQEIIRRYPKIERIRYIRLDIECKLMRKVVDWIALHVNEGIFDKDPQQLPEEPDPRDNKFIKDNIDLYTTLLKTAREYKIPTLVTALLRYAEEELRGNPSQEIKDVFDLK